MSGASTRCRLSALLARPGDIRMRRAIAILLAFAVITVLPAPARLVPVSVALAQDAPSIPGLGAVVLEDALAGTGPFRLRACPTGKNANEASEEGFRTRITGRCLDTSTSAPAIGLTASNGEVAIEVEVAEGLAVFRNVAISAIEGASDDRAPSYARPNNGPPTES